jgi:uncharacterized protein YjbI with pentapeptide repeats
MFSNANLEKTHAPGVPLAKARLHRANLKHTMLHEANLMGADLLKANLTGTRFTGANLQGANLQGAVGSPRSLIRKPTARCWSSNQETEAAAT